jgi:hypothetical protein
MELRLRVHFKKREEWRAIYSRAPSKKPGLIAEPKRELCSGNIVHRPWDDSVGRSVGKPVPWPSAPSCHSEENETTLFTRIPAK